MGTLPPTGVEAINPGDVLRRSAPKERPVFAGVRLGQTVAYSKVLMQLDFPFTASTVRGMHRLQLAMIGHNEI